MEDYLFLPFFIRVSEAGEEIRLPAESLCLMFVVRGHLRVCREETFLLHEMDLFSMQTVQEEQLELKDTREAVCAFCCISMDYVGSQCQFMMPQIWVNSARRGQYSDQKLYQEMMRLLSDYFSPALSERRLREDIRRIVHALLARAAESETEPYKMREKKLRYLMNQEYRREWTLQLLSQELALTQQYTSGYVRQVLGQPMNRYLSGRRLAALGKYLIHTQDTVTSLTGILGFSNIVSLNQAFRERYGQTPTQYRKEHASSAQPDILVSDNPYYTESCRLIGQLDSFGAPSGRKSGKKEIRCKKRDRSDMARPATDIAFVGEVRHLSDRVICEQLRSVSRELSLRYVRINTVFWPPDMEYDEKTGSYRFYRSFPAIGVIHELGMNPMILFRVDPSEPTDRMMEDFLAQAAREFGKERMGGWRFECVLADFNRPLWGLSAQEKKAIAVKLAAVSALIRRFCGTIEVGLYLYHAERVRPDDEELFGLPGVKELTWDFITVDLIAGYTTREDRYVSDSEKEYRFSANPHFLSRRMKTFHQVLERVYPDRKVPVYGNLLLDLHENLALNDTPYAAVFLLYQLQSCAGLLSGLILPTLSERNCIPFERPDDMVRMQPDGRLTHGIFSLLTDRGIPKPVFFALRFFRMLRETVIGTGDFFVLTGDPEGELVLLLFHYEHPTLFFCNHPYNLLPEDVDAVFHETEPDQVSVALPVRAGSWLLERYTLDENHGSVMALERGLDTSVALSGEIAAHIRAQIGPGYELMSMTAGEGGLCFEVTLPAHTAVLMRLIPV